MHLRADEWINLLAFSWLVTLAWRRRSLERQRRARIAAIGTGGLAITLFASLVLPHLMVPVAARVCRDWIPMILLLLFYRQAGLFVTGADAGFEERLHGLDRRLVVPLLEKCARSPMGVWIFAYLSDRGSQNLALFLPRQLNGLPIFAAETRILLCYSLVGKIRNVNLPVITLTQTRRSAPNLRQEGSSRRCNLHNWNHFHAAAQFQQSLAFCVKISPLSPHPDASRPGIFDASRDNYLGNSSPRPVTSPQSGYPQPQPQECAAPRPPTQLPT